VSGTTGAVMLGRGRGRFRRPRGRPPGRGGRRRRAKVPDLPECPGGDHAGKRLGQALLVS